MENKMMEMLEVQVKNSRKKRIVVLAALICVLAMLATGTYAYFTAEETAYNVITTAKLSMELVETTTGGQPWPEDGVHGVMPGMVIDKIVTIENNGGVDFYARIALDKIITDAEGKTDTLNFENITLDINTEYWTEQDGFYYYNAALKPGETTEPLFTAVTFEPELGNDYMDATIEIDVLAQAVQSRNNGDSALTAGGWSETIG